MSTAYGRIAGDVPCPICGKSLRNSPTVGARQPVYDCATCGTYQLSERAAQRLYEAVGPLTEGVSNCLESQAGIKVRE